MATFRVGDRVRLTVLPPWVPRLPPDSQRVFRRDKLFHIAEIDEYGHLVLDVSGEVDEFAGGVLNDIRVEPDFVELADGESGG
jgi:hypothetical protein